MTWSPRPCISRNSQQSKDTLGFLGHEEAELRLLVPPNDMQWITVSLPQGLKPRSIQGDSFRSAESAAPPKGFTRR